MRIIQKFLFIFIGLVLFTSCSLDEDQIPDVELNIFSITEDFQEWIVPFDSVGQTIQYRNNANSVAVIEVERTYNRGTQELADCRVDERQAECELQSINIAFPEDIHPDNFQSFISIFLVAPTEIQVIANRVGITAAVALFDGNTNMIDTDFPDNYAISYQPGFLYNGQNRPAIITETFSFENIPEGVIIPPKKMILVMGVGIVEWQDYNGNTWTLEN